jgi:hypothetical protein
VDPVAIGAVVTTGIAGLVGAYLALKKAPTERDGVFISTAEGATRILNSAMLTLEKDNERMRRVIEELQLDGKAKNDALRRKDAMVAQQQARIVELEQMLGQRKRR